MAPPHLDARHVRQHLLHVGTELGRQARPQPCAAAARLLLLHQPRAQLCDLHTQHHPGAGAAVHHAAAAHLQQRRQRGDRAAAALHQARDRLLLLRLLLRGRRRRHGLRRRHHGLPMHLQAPEGLQRALC